MLVSRRQTLRGLFAAAFFDGGVHAGMSPILPVAVTKFLAQPQLSYAYSSGGLSKKEGNMTLIPMPIEWASLSAQGTRYSLMYDLYKISHASAENFFKEIDVPELDNFVGDLHLQSSENYVGMILFEDELDDVAKFVYKLLDISNRSENVSIDEVLEFINYSRHLFALMSKHGEITIYDK